MNSICRTTAGRCIFRSHVIASCALVGAHRHLYLVPLLLLRSERRTINRMGVAANQPGLVPEVKAASETFKPNLVIEKPATLISGESASDSICT